MIWNKGPAVLWLPILLFVSGCASSPERLSDDILGTTNYIVVGNMTGPSRLAGLKLHIDDFLIAEFNVGEYLRFGLGPGNYEMKITPVVSLLGPVDKVEITVNAGDRYAYNVERADPTHTSLLISSAKQEFLMAVNPVTYDESLKTCCVDVSIKNLGRP